MEKANIALGIAAGRYIFLSLSSCADVSFIREVGQGGQESLHKQVLQMALLLKKPFTAGHIFQKAHVNSNKMVLEKSTCILAIFFKPFY